MKAINYSLFKADDPNCHTFESFLRFLPITLRAHKVLFPDYEFLLHLDPSVNGKYFDFIKALPLKIVYYTRQYKLCKAMLRRLMLLHNYEGEYDYFFCRDIDSLPTYRERQAMDQFIATGLVAHGINDSVSHTIPMLGGMIGFSKEFWNIYLLNQLQVDVETCGIDFSQKGSDQTFINQYIYPKVKDKMFSHKILGMDCNADLNCTNVIADTECIIDRKYKDCDKLVNHIGQGGFHFEPTHNTITDVHYEGAQVYWRREYYDEQIEEAEKLLPEIFYWHE